LPKDYADVLDYFERTAFRVGTTKWVARFLDNNATAYTTYEALLDFTWR
jgi:hypothetical protein